MAFVRWKQRPYSSKRSPARGDGYSLTASIVECRRVNKKPRQRYLAHLSSIAIWLTVPGWLREDEHKMLSVRDGKVSPIAVHWLWANVRDTLATLNGTVNQKSIEDKIARVVPRLDPLTRSRLVQEHRQEQESLRNSLVSRDDRFQDMADAVMFGKSGLAKAMLGLPPRADETDVREIYRRLSQQTHPDRGGDPELFEVVSRICQTALGKPVVTHEMTQGNFPATTARGAA